MSRRGTHSKSYRYGAVVLRQNIRPLYMKRRRIKRHLRRRLLGMDLSLVLDWHRCLVRMLF